VVAEDEADHGLEHRHVDALAAAGALAREQGGQDAAHRRQADDPVGHRRRDVARRALAGPRDQVRQRGTALDQVVVRGAGRVGAVLAEAE